LERTEPDIYRAELSRIVDNIFRTMLETEVDQCPRECAPRPEQMTAKVAFDGTWTGELALRANPQQARHFAELFFGAADGDLEEESRDVMGELANIIAGNLMVVLPRGAHHGTPLVIFGGQPYLSELPILAEACFRLNDNVFSLELANDEARKDGSIFVYENSNR
jgi:CheY-specific phosphatase CheX